MLSKKKETGTSQDAAEVERPAGADAIGRAHAGAGGNSAERRREMAFIGFRLRAGEGQGRGGCEENRPAASEGRCRTAAACGQPSLETVANLGEDDTAGLCGSEPGAR